MKSLFRSMKWILPTVLILGTVIQYSVLVQAQTQVPISSQQPASSNKPGSRQKNKSRPVFRWTKPPDRTQHYIRTQHWDGKSGFVSGCSDTFNGFGTI